MDIKLCFLAIISLGQIYEGGAVECYECISYRITGYEYLQNQDCEDGSDIDNTRSECLSCGKVDYYVSYQYTDQSGARQSLREEVVYRGCLDYFEDDECIDVKTYAKRDGTESEFLTSLELDFEQTLEVTNAEVTSWDGDACICNDDLCNSAAQATTSVTMVILAIATLLLQ